jgi:hypothetical protein
MFPRLQSNLDDLRWRDDDRLGYTRRQSRNNGCNEGLRIIIAKRTLLLVVVPFPSCSCIFDDDRRYLRTVPYVPIHGRRFRHHPHNFRYESSIPQSYPPPPSWCNCNSVLYTPGFVPGLSDVGVLTMSNGWTTIASAMPDSAPAMNNTPLLPLPLPLSPLPLPLPLSPPSSFFSDSAMVVVSMMVRVVVVLDNDTVASLLCRRCSRLLRHSSPMLASGHDLQAKEQARVVGGRWSVVNGT